MERKGKQVQACDPVFHENASDPPDFYLADPLRPATYALLDSGPGTWHLPLDDLYIPDSGVPNRPGMPDGLQAELLILFW